MSDCGMNVDESVGPSLVNRLSEATRFLRKCHLSEGLGPPALSKTWTKPYKITRKGQM